MPWSMDNPPPPAKNWTPSQKRRCIAAANRTLSEGRSEEQGIFACIGAAGKSRKKQRNRATAAQVSLYEQKRDKVKLEFERLANGYLSGNISLAGFKSEMRERLKQYYIRV